jgi:hypothetical protein
MATEDVLPKYLRIFCRLALLALCVLFGHMYIANAQLSTDDHLAESAFWPTQSNPSREAFAGPEACARCHGSMVASQQETPMARNFMAASASDILHTHPNMSFAITHYQYKMQTAAGQTRYSVNDGTNTLAYPLLWAFGTGRVGQSYLFRKEDGAIYEARVTYFASLTNLGFTPDRALTSPANLEEAMGRQVPASEVARCFNCHTTASTINGSFDEKHLIPGVTCEACHGPGAAHVKAMDDYVAGKSSAHSAPPKTSIFNSAHLSPNDAVDFCGACHTTWWDVKLSGMTGVRTARSAPARLVSSKCWGKGDDRLVCTACHDPHQQLQTDPAAYDHTCLSCHANAPGAQKTAAHPGVACPVARKNCTSCHMPKTYVPNMHDNFTDHRIRIVKAGEPYPD